MSATNHVDRVLSRGECAYRANLSLATFDRLVKAGKGPPLLALSERRRGVKESDLNAWLNSRLRDERHQDDAA
jgi:predicted DNA-binding transcriptional regulator AlpA